MNRMYHNLSQVRFLSKSYSFKFLFIAFLGIHIPLIGLVGYVSFRSEVVNPLTVLLLTLLLTLAATGITLFVLNGLLNPLHRSSQALDRYITQREVPQLPVHYRDEAGRLMQNIQFTVQELNELLEEKRDLVSLLSHDLRTPLHNIKMLGDLLKHETDDATRMELVEMITESSAEQLKLLENILALLRQDHALEDSAVNEKVNTEVLVDELLQVFAAPAREKGIRLQKQIEYNGDLHIKPELFKQAMKNLVSNAIKFSHPEGEVQIAVRKLATETLIEVADTGIGFNPETNEQLFDRFTVHRQIGTSGEVSTGIGLSLSRKIIKRHKGELKATSAGPNQGATFTISLYQ